MKNVLRIICILVLNHVSYGDEEHTELKSEPPAYKLSAEAEAIQEKQKKEHDAAMARLPPLDAERMDNIITTLRKITYPISFESLREKLGGSDALVWCCTYFRSKNRAEFDKETDSFFVANTDPIFGEYKLIVDYEDFAPNTRPTVVSRARLCYSSPFGWRFVAESMDDYLHVGAVENNRLSEDNPTMEGSKKK